MCCCSPTTIDTNRREGKMLTGIALVNAIHLWKPHLIRCNSWGYAHIFNHIQLIYKSIFVNRWHHSYQFGFFFVYFTSSDFSVYFICLLHFIFNPRFTICLHSSYWSITSGIFPFLVYYVFHLSYTANVTIKQPTNQPKKTVPHVSNVHWFVLFITFSFIRTA